VHAPDTKQTLKAEKHNSCVHYVCVCQDANARRTHRRSCCRRRLQRALPAAVPRAAAAAAPRACPPAPRLSLSTTTRHIIFFLVKEETSVFKPKTRLL